MTHIAIDGAEFTKRLIKYIMEGLVVAFAAFFIPGKKISGKEVVIIGVIAAATFSVLDLVAPAIGNSVRQGAGMGVGFNLVNFPGGGGPNPGFYMK